MSLSAGDQRQRHEARRNVCGAGMVCPVSWHPGRGHSPLSTRGSCMFSDQVGPEPSVTGRACSLGAGPSLAWLRLRVMFHVTPSGATVQPTPGPDNYHAECCVINLLSITIWRNQAIKSLKFYNCRRKHMVPSPNDLLGGLEGHMKSKIY